MRSFWIGFHDITCFVVIAALMSHGMEIFANDPGVGWHLKTGQLILERRSFLFTDPFLYQPSGSPERPWVCDQWLSDVIMELAYKIGEWPFLYAIFCFVFFVTFLLVQYQFLRIEVSSALAASFACFASTLFGVIHFILRPVVFSFPFFLLIFWYARRQAFLQAGKDSSSKFVYLFVMMLLWANIHPSFTLGLIWLALVPISRVAEFFISSHNENFPGQALRGDAMALLVALLATLVNPNGIYLHQSIIELGTNSYFMDLHDEWKSLNFKSPYGVFFSVITSLIIFSQYFYQRVFKSEISLKSFDLLSLSAGTFLACRSVRLLPLFGIVTAPVLADSLMKLSSLAAHFFSDLIPVTHASFNRLNDRLSRLRDGLVLVPCYCLFLFGWTWWFQSLPGYEYQSLGPSRNSYPYQALTFMLSRDQKDLFSGSPGVFAPSNWGGFITLAGYPTIQATIDDRNTLLGRDFFAGYLKALTDPVELGCKLKMLDTRLVLLERESLSSKMLKNLPTYKVLFEDSVATLFRYTADFPTCYAENVSPKVTCVASKC